MFELNVIWQILRVKGVVWIRGQCRLWGKCSILNKLIQFFMHPTHFISNPRQVHMEGNQKWRLFSEECSSSESQKAGWSQLGVSSEMMERRPWRFIWGINIPPKRSFSMLKVCCILASWLFLWVPFHCSWGYSWKKKCSLFLTKIVRLATVIFWISTFSSTVSCKISLLPHQYPNFVFKLLNFTTTTNCPNLC